MKISRKLRNKILDGISDAATEVMKEQCPSIVANADPSDWTQEDITKRDLILKVSLACSQKAAAIMNAAV